MKFKFVMYKGDFSNPNNNHAQYRKPEGSITVESGSNTIGNQKTTDGDYIDYEEVK